MARSEALKAAQAAYRERKKAAGKFKTVTVEFYEQDLDVYQHLDAQENKRQYILGLIRADMGE